MKPANVIIDCSSVISVYISCSFEWLNEGRVAVISINLYTEYEIICGTITSEYSMLWSWRRAEVYSERSNLIVFINYLYFHKDSLPIYYWESYNYLSVL